MPCAAMLPAIPDAIAPSPVSLRARLAGTDTGRPFENVSVMSWDLARVGLLSAGKTLGQDLTRHLRDHGVVIDMRVNF